MDRFARSARTLAGLSARTLGWAPDVFWAATPEELALCLEQQDTAPAPPTRVEIEALIERDQDGR